MYPSALGADSWRRPADSKRDAFACSEEDSPELRDGEAGR